MVLYIVKHISWLKEYPPKLIDENVKTDYTRLRKIAENFISREQMMEIVEIGHTDAIEIKDKFNLESLYKGEEKGCGYHYWKALFCLLCGIGLIVIDYNQSPFLR
jgi:hypothetical protein